MFGFPFGNALALNKGNPAVTVGKGSVSSIRLNDRGDVALVQIDGDLNPGNSGGPVVDEKGRLVGVAVAQIRETRIGFAIPHAELTNMLGGRVTAASILRFTQDKGTVRFNGERWVLDRLNKIQSTAGLSMSMSQNLTPVKKDKGVLVEAQLLDP